MKNKKSLESYFEPKNTFDDIRQRFRRGYDTANISYELSDFCWNNWEKIAEVGEKNFNFPSRIIEIDKRITEARYDPIQSLATLWHTITHPIKTFISIIKDYISRVNYVNYRRSRGYSS